MKTRRVVNQSEWDFPTRGFYPKINDMLTIKVIVPKNLPKTYFGELARWTIWVIILGCKFQSVGQLPKVIQYESY